jgi:hypothetical protein
MKYKMHLKKKVLLVYLDFEPLSLIKTFIAVITFYCVNAHTFTMGVCTPVWSIYRLCFPVFFALMQQKC